MNIFQSYSVKLSDVEIVLIFSNYQTYLLTPESFHGILQVMPGILIHLSATSRRLSHTKH